MEKPDLPVRSGKATPFHGVRDRAENGNLCKLGWTYCHGTMFAPRQCLYQREAMGMESQEMYSNKWVQKFHLLVWAGNLPRLMGGSIVPRTETWVNWGGPIAMVPFLHKRNIYIQRKLRVERDQKCIPLVGAETSLTFVVRQTTPFHGGGGRYRAENGNLRELGWTYCHGTVFAAQKYLYPKGSYRYGKNKNVFQ